MLGPLNTSISDFENSFRDLLKEQAKIYSKDSYMIDFRPKVVIANKKYELENNSDFDDGIPVKELDDLQ